MAQATEQQRFEVLTRWRNEAMAAGHAVPSEVFIRAFAGAGASALALAESSNETAVGPWLPTLAFFAKQWPMGVIWPDLPNYLKAPTGEQSVAAALSAPPADPSAPPTDSAVPVTSAEEAPAEAAALTPTDQRLEALTAWRDKALDYVSSAGAATAEAVARTPGERFEALKAWRDKALESLPDSVANLKESHLRTIARTELVTPAEIASSLPASLSKLADPISDVLAKIAPSTATPLSSAPPTSTPRSAEPAASQPTQNAQPATEPPQSTEAQAASVNPQRPHGTGPSNDVDPSGFVPYDFSRASDEVIALHGSGTEDSGFVLTWDGFPSPHPVVLYRVVSSDQNNPWNPDTADLVVSTVKTSATDSRPFESAVRYVQVWANSGMSVAEAKLSQAVLHAQAAFIAPPRNVDIREDEGRVIGQWETWPGTTRVMVFRVPIERAAHESGAPQHNILSDHDNLGGFVDTGATRGSRYLYQAVAEAPVDGVGQRSFPLVRPVLVSDVIEQVVDLAVIRHGEDEPQFDLNWSTPPGGQVVIYRSEQPPRPGADLKPLPESALAQADLRDADRLAHPISRADGKASMKDVPWPRAWTRAYFTPVTLLNGQAFVGISIASVHTEKIKRAKIVERVNKQVLTFQWPDGAASVFVYEGVSGQPAEVATQNAQAHEITKDQYVQRGGLTFPRRLPSKGCDIHLVPITFLAGERVMGAPTTISYGRLFRLRYEIKQQRNVVGAITGVSVGVRSEEEMGKPPPFVLVYNPDRLPLSKADGRVLTVAPEAVEGSPISKRLTFSHLGASAGETWKTPADAWKSEVGKPRGFVRLFVDLPPDGNIMVALIDPAPTALRLEGILGKIGGLVGG